MNLLTYPIDPFSLLKELVRIPSFSREEEKVADYLENYLAGHCGYKPRRIGNNLVLYAKHWQEGLPVILLNAHIDTVKPVSGWTYDPFTPLEQEGRIYGLGTNDDGASLVSLLTAFLVLDRQSQPYNLLFVASAEEEVSGRQGIESVRTYLPDCAFALVGEPTGMQPAIAEKGLMVLDCTAHGKAGHAARNEGVNAIYKAMKDIGKIESFVFPGESPLLGKVKATVTLVQAGTQHNVVPDECRFTIDVRSNELYSNRALYELIDEALESEVQARSFRLNSSSIALDHPFVKKVIDSGRVPFGSPTLSDQALLPFPSLKMGPGDSARSHSANEYIVCSEIDEAIRCYVAWLDGFSI